MTFNALHMYLGIYTYLYWLYVGVYCGQTVWMYYKISTKFENVLFTKISNFLHYPPECYDVVLPQGNDNIVHFNGNFDGNN